MIIPLCMEDDLAVVCRLLSTDPQAALRVLDLRIAAMAGNAQVIPIRTKSRCTVQTWPTPPQPAA